MNVLWVPLIFFTGWPFSVSSFLPDSLEISKSQDRTFVPAQEYAPIVKSKPSILIPDSLLPLMRGTVKILIRVNLDSNGVPHNPRVIKSTDKRFNQVAIKFAVQYRFDIRAKPIPHGFDRAIIIPIIFRDSLEKK